LPLRLGQQLEKKGFSFKPLGERLDLFERLHASCILLVVGCSDTNYYITISNLRQRYGTGPLYANVPLPSAPLKDNVAILEFKQQWTRLELRECLNNDTKVGKDYGSAVYLQKHAARRNAACRGRLEHRRSNLTPLYWPFSLRIHHELRNSL
jgi:hypothetical protein